MHKKECLVESEASTVVTHSLKNQTYFILAFRDHEFSTLKLLCSVDNSVSYRVIRVDSLVCVYS
jgi:hypothetical protein